MQVLVAGRQADCCGDVPVRNCGGCGRRLSIYNDGTVCRECSASDDRLRQSYARTGDIGIRLRSLRLQRGMTLTVLAGLCGVSPAYLSMVENGKRKLDRWSTIVALANGLRIPPAELALDDPAGSRAEVKEAN
jgi:DNA-binding XRE family transcriptional regulator